MRVTLIEPGVVATELPTHITHAETGTAANEMYSRAEVTAEVIAFAVSRPRHLAINEILLRPSGQIWTSDTTGDSSPSAKASRRGRPRASSRRMSRRHLHARPRSPL